MNNALQVHEGKSTENRCLISVVIATWNCANCIEACLQSVTGQDFESFEVLIVDGGSSDGTLEIINCYADRLAWWDSSQDEGVYDAWNRALPRTRGEWILFIGSDDTLYSRTTLTEAAKALQCLPATGKRLAYGRVRMIDAFGKVTSEIGAPPEPLLWQFRHGMPKQVPHTGMFHHASLFHEFGVFDGQFRISGDYAFILRVLKTRPDALCFLPDLIVALKGEGGLSSNPNAILECYHARKKNGLRGLTLFWLAVYMRARSRQFLKRRRMWAETVEAAP